VGTNVLTLIATDPFTKKEVGVQSFSVPKPEVTLTTTLGSLVVILEPEKAPLSSQNFLDVVASGYYKGTVFHDLMLGNRLLGGLYALNGEIWSPKTSSEVSTVEFESPLATGLSNTDGTIAVYRLPNSSLNSGSTGFLINLGDHGRIGNRRDGTSPDHSAYAVFGRLNEKSRELITKAIDTRSIVPKPPMNPTTSFPFEPPSPAVWISNATQTN
jgi:cyclophilin family peptidyl-prolyl cis-trans isomerase